MPEGGLYLGAEGGRGWVCGVVWMLWGSVLRWPETGAESESEFESQRFEL